MKDFFISYNKADRAWAEWIGWILEDAGYSVVIQAWDFRPGENFVLEMHRATSETSRTIAVLSDSYLNALYTQPEWAAAFSSDPTGQQRQLIPIRVQPCKPAGLLASLIYIDIVGASEQDARLAILGAFSTRGKPSRAPRFPGVETDNSRHSYVPFPGETSNAAGGNLSDSIIATACTNQLTDVNISPRPDHVPNASFSANERLALARDLSAIPPQQFNIIVFALDPPPGIIPPMPAPQGDRAHALLEWAKGPGGCSLHDVQRIFNELLEPAGEALRANPNPTVLAEVLPPRGLGAAEAALVVDAPESAGKRITDEATPSSANSGGLNLANPLAFLREAIAAVPAVKYALGVGGVAAVIAIIAGFQINFSVAVFGVIIIFGLMFVLLIFSKFTEIASESFKPLSLVLAWTFVVLTVAVATLLVTSFFWRWPRALDQYMPSDAPVNGQTSTPRPTPTPVAQPPEHVNEWSSPFTKAERLEDHWHYPAGMWRTEPGEEAESEPNDEALLVKGQEMGVPNDLDGRVFYDFRAVFKIRFKNGGSRAAWVLRAQPDRAGGYLFELVQEGADLNLYFWIYEEGRKKGRPLKKDTLPFRELRESQWLSIDAEVKGNRFDHLIIFGDDSSVPNPNRGQRVSALFQDDASNVRWPWGVVGFMVTDDISVMRVESIDVYPLPRGR